jgi:hypothetical protein
VKARQVGARLDEAFQFGHRFGALLQIEQGEAEVVASLGEGGLQRQRAAMNLHGPAGAAQLPFRLTEQREELGSRGHDLEGGLRFLARAFGPADIEIDPRQCNAGGDQVGLDRDRLAQLRGCLVQHRPGSELSIGEAQQQMGFGGARIDGKDAMQLADRGLDVSPGEDDRPDAVQPGLH